MKRRIIVAALLAATAGAAWAQGKKGSGNNSSNDGMARVLGIDGTYSAYGRNPDGSDYEGRCEIVQQGDAVEFTWFIGDGENRGAGNIDGRVVTVDWGDATPVVYVVMDDGELHGTWADGTAFEKLTPR